MRLLRASPYRDFTGLIHQGKIHLLKSDICESPRTWCGKTELSCPGTIFPGLIKEVTCKVCRNSFEIAQRYEENRKEWEREAAAREAQREENNRQWWASYEQYLLSATWREKRRKVMGRYGGICEGCWERKATEVHHKTYPKGVRPGSLEWIRSEKLFDLVALCEECHRELHPGKASLF